MAQTSSATREPSMEEILASIRRIIEDSDVTKQATAELTATPKAPEPAAEDRRGEVTQFPRPAAVETIQTEARASAPSFTLDAVLRGSISEQQTPEVTRAEQHERNVAHVRIATVNPPVPPVVVAAAEQPKADAIKMSEALLMQVAEKRVVSMPQPTAKEEATPVTESATETATHSFSAATEEKPLISQAAEKQVAASFGSLSQALLEEQKRLLNDKMEAMLRPMLQEWLDTNLPPLVERLVREEIERVVRRG